MFKASRIVVTPSAYSAELLPGGSLKPVHLRGGMGQLCTLNILKKSNKYFNFLDLLSLKER
jgi:hypothetical protein